MKSTYLGFYLGYISPTAIGGQGSTLNSVLSGGPKVSYPESTTFRKVFCIDGLLGLYQSFYSSMGGPSVHMM